MGQLDIVLQYTWSEGSEFVYQSVAATDVTSRVERLKKTGAKLIRIYTYKSGERLMPPAPAMPNWVAE